MSNTLVGLVLDTGDIIEINCPSKREDELFNSIDHCMKNNDWWSPQRFKDCTAKFRGMDLERVNMSRVVGML